MDLIITVLLLIGYCLIRMSDRMGDAMYRVNMELRQQRRDAFRAAMVDDELCRSVMKTALLRENIEYIQRFLDDVPELGGVNIMHHACGSEYESENRMHRLGWRYAASAILLARQGKVAVDWIHYEELRLDSVGPLELTQEQQFALARAIQRELRRNGADHQKTELAYYENTRSARLEKHLVWAYLLPCLYGVEEARKTGRLQYL